MTTTKEQIILMEFTAPCVTAVKIDDMATAAMQMKFCWNDWTVFWRNR